LTGLGRKRSGAPAVFLAAVLFTLSGCALLQRGTVASLPQKVWQPGERLQALAERDRQFRSLRALARVNYAGKDGRASFDEAILVQRPDRLRLETLTSVGALLVVTIDGKEIVGFHPREGLFYRGESSRRNIFRLTRLPLDLEEWTSLLFGIPPGGARGGWREAGPLVQRQLDGGEREIAEFHPNWPAPSRWERASADGTVILRATFSDFLATPHGPFPLRISLEAPAEERRFEIRYQAPDLNVEIPGPVFVQEKPASAREVPLESLGG
jgi:hypothetical protein